MLFPALSTGVGVYFCSLSNCQLWGEGAPCHRLHCCVPAPAWSLTEEVLCQYLLIELGRVQGAVVVGTGIRKWWGFLSPGRTSENLGTIKCPPCSTTGDRRSREGNALVQAHVASLWQSWDLTPEPFGVHSFTGTSSQTPAVLRRRPPLASEGRRSVLLSVMTSATGLAVGERTTWGSSYEWG